MWAKRLKNDLFLKYSSRLLKQHAKFNSLYFFTSWFAFVLSLQIYFKLWSRTDSLDISLMLSCRTIELCFIFLLFSSLYYFIFFMILPIFTLELLSVPVVLTSPLGHEIVKFCSSEVAVQSPRSHRGSTCFFLLSFLHNFSREYADVLQKNIRQSSGSFVGNDNVWRVPLLENTLKSRCWVSFPRFLWFSK